MVADRETSRPAEPSHDAEAAGKTHAEAVRASRERKARAETTMNQLVEGSLSGLLESLDRDPSFHALATDDFDRPEGAADPSIVVGAPEGVRPALAAAVARRSPVVYLVASGREAEETVNALRSWYDGDPNDIAQLEAWETLPHERLSPRADTVASCMAVFQIGRAHV